MLSQKIKDKSSGILLYGITPPKKETSLERLKEISDLQRDRLKRLKPDGLILYDIQDEAMRLDATRPYPFMETLDPIFYGHEYLHSIDIPKIYYRAVGKYTADALSQDMLKIKGEAIVLVGSPSSNFKSAINIADAYVIRREMCGDLLLGGVAIPERHLTKKDEHLRVINKMSAGCSFFITQCVYDVENTKNFLSDYYYHCQAAEIDMVPIVLTMTPCGSLKTLEFMKWLGVNIPRWLENDLAHSGDILASSINACRNSFEEILSFANDKKIPIGCNIESVATRKDEIEASLMLGESIKTLFNQ